MRATPVALALALGASAMAVPCPRPAHAQTMGGDFALDGFRPALDTRGFVTVDGAEVLPAGQPSFGLVTTWARGLLELAGDGASYRVDHVVSPTLLAAIGLPGPLGLELAAALPFGIVAADRGPDSDGGTPGAPNDDDDYRRGGQGLGDVGVHAKVRLGARGRLAAAAIADLTLPTASRGVWLGAGATGGGARLVVEWRGPGVRLGAHAGIRLRAGGDAAFVDDGAVDGGPATGEVVTAGPAIPAGVAVGWEVSPGRIELIGEIAAAIPLRGDLAPVEASAALRVRLAEASHFTIGAGTGLAPGAGNPDVRAVMAIVFEPRPPARARVVTEDVEVPPDAPRPGDLDDDTLVDTLDDCPEAAEDLDGFEDDDGCPDLDNDRDRLLDVDDLCPDEPEDRDGLDDEDGCPETDFDRDLIDDVDDACPTARGIAHDDPEQHGCPDRRRVRVGDGELEVFEDVFFEFDSAVIQERSHDILRVVAATLIANEEITRVEIGGHTDDRGAAAYNEDLSQRRAEAVRAFLIEEGVDGDRLEAHGYGEAVPKMKGRGEKVWSTNRRVEFLILARR